MEGTRKGGMKGKKKEGDGRVKEGRVWKGEGRKGMEG